MSGQDRKFLIILRGALIQALNAIDDLLGLPRTVPPRKERLQSS